MVGGGEKTRSPTASVARAEAAFPRSAVVLAGDAARDHERIDALVRASVIVILVPGLDFAWSAVAPHDPLRVAPAQGIPPHAGDDPIGDDPLETSGDLSVDLMAHRVLCRGREVHVSERELRILGLLSEEPGRARGFEELAELEHDGWLGHKEQLRSAIKRLRKKLAAARMDVRIESVPGFGFRLSA